MVLERDRTGKSVPRSGSLRGSLPLTKVRLADIEVRVMASDLSASESTVPMSTLVGGITALSWIAPAYPMMRGGSLVDNNGSSESESASRLYTRGDPEDSSLEPDFERRVATA